MTLCEKIHRYRLEYKNLLIDVMSKIITLGETLPLNEMDLQLKVHLVIFLKNQIYMTSFLDLTLGTFFKLLSNALVRSLKSGVVCLSRGTIGKLENITRHLFHVVI